MVRHGDSTWTLNEGGELIILELTVGGFRGISRARLIEPATLFKQQRSGFVQCLVEIFSMVGRLSRCRIK